jgi:cyclopropane-fatty-acyl-phospholipid synthase
MIFRLMSTDLPWEKVLSAGMVLVWLREKLLNRQRPSRAFAVGEVHYDLGNDLYTRMLDKRMVYTCGYWEDAQTLDAAQEAKLDLVCRKLDLKKGDRILDIGCGWGSFMKYAAEHYDVSCIGLTVSEGQTKLGREMCEGLPIEFVVNDYRHFYTNHQFDHVVSIEMFEAVGHKNYRTFMRKVASLLKDEGRFLLQTIGSTHPRPDADPWIERYIFPNGILPSRPLIERAIRGVFVAHDWHDIGHDYDRTLMEWWRNFQKNYNELDHSKYDDRFYRMWQYYLLMCAGGFRSGELLDWQIMLTKGSGALLSEIR